MKTVRAIRKSDLPPRKQDKSKFNLGPRREPDEAPLALRTLVLLLLAGRTLSAADLWAEILDHSMDSARLFPEVLDDLVERQVVTTHRRRDTPTGPPVTCYELTAK